MNLSIREKKRLVNRLVNHIFDEIFELKTDNSFVCDLGQEVYIIDNGKLIPYRIVSYGTRQEDGTDFLKMELVLWTTDKV